MGDLRPEVWTSHPKCHGNNVSYAQALRCLADVAIEHRTFIQHRQPEKDAQRSKEISWFPRSSGKIGEGFSEEMSVLIAGHKICADDVLSPCSTPATDTSAMDGFAVESVLTANASAEYPVKFRVAGIMAAGADIRNNANLELDRSSAAGDSPCVEIMTGAPFPEHQFPQLDAVVKVEDVELVEDLTSNKDSMIKYILVSSPVKRYQHWRPAGTDFQPGDLIIAKGARVEPKHIMALTSVGVGRISVIAESTRRTTPNGLRGSGGPRVGVLPTGSELVNLFNPTDDPLSRESDYRQRFPDSNGPYMTAAIKSMSSSSDVDYIGPCPDDEQNLIDALSKAVRAEQYDLLVTSGGVSMGRFDLVRKVLEHHLGAEVIFHGCLVRPGAPVLFGVIGQRNNSRISKHGKMTTFIGAPGNPIAAAMTVRFFIKPYLKMLQAPLSCSIGDLVQMTLSESLPVQVNIFHQDKMRKKPMKAVAFLLAKNRTSEDASHRTSKIVDLLEDQASYKIKPFLQSDCWITALAGKDKMLDGDHTQAYSLW